MKRIFWVAALALVLASGSLAKNESPSSITISAPADAVKSAVVARLTAHGFHLESDSQFQMVWAKEMNGVSGVLAQAVIGNANCGMPKLIVDLTFAPQGDSVLVVGQEELDTATTLCTRQRVTLNEKKNREAMASFLSDIKAKAEAQAKK